MPLSKQRSVDDLIESLSTLVRLPSRRSQSTSPTKNSRPNSCIFFGQNHSSDDTTSALSSTNGMSYNQIRELSRSPILKNLHIKRADYAIPIPFTLQLPPRLLNSAPTTPKSTNNTSVASPKSPSRLVFTGKSYEAVQSDSDSDLDFFQSQQGLGSPAAAKPPSVAFSRKKVAKFVKNTNSIPLDQLSMIEEASRASSVHSKGLPMLPKSPSHHVLLRKPPPDIDPMIEEPVAKHASVTIEDSGNVIVGSARSEEKENMAKIEKTVDDRHNEKFEMDQNKKDFVSGAESTHLEKVLDISALPALERNVVSNKTNETEPERKIESMESKKDENRHIHSNVGHCITVQEKSLHDATLSPLIQLQTLRHSTGFHHHLNRGELRIDKRTFSDESHVSSISSFSSVGDHFNINPYAHSLQESRIPPRGPLLHLKKQEIRNSRTSDADIPEVDMPELLNETADKTIEIDLPRKVNDTEANQGAGIGFNFPNNSSNITNSIKPRVLKPSTPVYTPIKRGQIEIPDLSELKVTLPNTSSMESIGVPTRAARDHVNSMYGDIFSESDSDSSFNSQFTKLNPQLETKLCETSNSSKTVEKELPELPSATRISTSPVRHVRRRSMFNINFDDDMPQASPERKHSRSKSDMTLLKGIVPLKLNRGPEESKSSPSVTPKVIVAPPERVQYAVDFRAPSRNPERSESFSGKRPLPTYHISPSRSSGSSNTEYCTAAGSETASSYQSSRSARDTASTAPTDTNSVVIDLTKDGYNLCMIQRNDSQLSYRSVIEKTKDGKEVEVVLVEEDENDNDRDELMSIYSSYMRDWVDRADSVKSTVSDTSSTASWANSEKNFNVKSLASLKRDQPYKLAVAPHIAEMRNIKTGNLQSPLKTSNRLQKEPESRYFDYNAGDNYDFNTFINQRKAGIK